MAVGAACLQMMLLALRLPFRALFFCSSKGLMVKDGYVAVDQAGQALRGHSLPQEWNEVPNLWAFIYSRCACRQGTKCSVACDKTGLPSSAPDCLQTDAWEWVPLIPPAWGRPAAQLPAPLPALRACAGRALPGCFAWSAGSTQQHAA